MLTKRDLRLTQAFFSLHSKLMWIPFTFKPVMLGGDGGQMENGRIPIRRRIGFKMTQLLVTCQGLFVSYRTLEYMTCGDEGFFGEGQGRSDDEKGEHLNWDFVPIMLIGTSYYLTLDAVPYLIFDLGRQLNSKIVNEFIKLRGKTNQFS